MLKKDKVINPIQKKVCTYSWGPEIPRSIIFQRCGRTNSPLHAINILHSYSRHILYSDLVGASNGVRICLRKRK